MSELDFESLKKDLNAAVRQKIAIRKDRDRLAALLQERNKTGMHPAFWFWSGFMLASTLAFGLVSWVR